MSHNSKSLECSKSTDDFRNYYGVKQNGFSNDSVLIIEISDTEDDCLLFDDKIKNSIEQSGISKESALLQNVSDTEDGNLLLDDEVNDSIEQSGILNASSSEPVSTATEDTSTNVDTLFEDKLNYKYRSFVNEKRRPKLWAVEFNYYLKIGQPNIFAVVGGPQFSIYEVTPYGKMKNVVRFKDPDPKEDFYTCCWSINATKTRSVLIAAGERGVIRICEVHPQETCATPKHLIGHGAAVNQVKISPRKPFLLASASKDHSVRLWNIETMVCIATFHGVDAHRDGVVSIDFNHTCEWLVSGGTDHTIMIWDINIPEIAKAIEESKQYDESKSNRGFKTLNHPFPIYTTRFHTQYVDAVQWHGNFIFSKSADDTLCCWKPIIRKHSKSKLPSHPTIYAKFPINACNYYFMRFTINADHSIVALGNAFGMIRLYRLDVKNPTEIPFFDLRFNKCKDIVRDIAFSRCGHDLVFCCEDGTIWLWQNSSLQFQINNK